MRTNDDGFTLAELLVAVSVLVLIVLFVSQLLNQTTTMTTLGHKRMDADAGSRQLLDRMIVDTGHQLDAVVVIAVNQEELVQRLLARAQTEGRADDTEDVIRRRQEIYHAETEPLIAVYLDRGLVHEIDGMGEVEDVTKRIFEALDVVEQS